MASYPHVFEYPYSAVDNVPFEMKGNWHQQFFKNDNPIVLELAVESTRWDWDACFPTRISSA